MAGDSFDVQLVGGKLGRLSSDVLERLGQLDPASRRRNEREGRRDSADEPGSLQQDDDGAEGAGRLAMEHEVAGAEAYLQAPQDTDEPTDLLAHGAATPTPPLASQDHLELAAMLNISDIDSDSDINMSADADQMLTSGMEPGQLVKLQAHHVKELQLQLEEAQLQLQKNIADASAREEQLQSSLVDLKVRVVLSSHLRLL